MRKKKPQESTSAEAVEESKPVKKNRLAGMLEAIEKRSDPVKAHNVATEYFKAFRSERGLLSEEKKPKDIEENPETISEEIVKSQDPLSSTPVVTPVETPVISKRKRYETFEPLDATHSSSEARVYSSMYRETISKGTNTQYFGTKRLMTLTGIRGDHTVRRAIDGLIAKRSIEIIDSNYGNPIGPRYKIYSPKAIFERRKEVSIEIDPQTKKIIAPDMTPVETPVKMTGVTPVKTTPVTPVKTTGVEPDIPYITKNNINRDDSIKSIESSSKSSSKEDDSDDTFNHRNHVISLYERYTGNQWRVGDDEFYESENLREILPEVIEAAVIASVLRSKTKMNSFAYCKGAIEEFQESLPPGYLGHLRKEWRKAKSKEVDKKEDTETETTPVSLSLPRDSYFEEGWLKNYILGFPNEEQARIKRLAERFDHFMITAGEKKQWVKNPTGTFIGVVRGEVNVPIAKQAPTFEERLDEERRIEEEEKIREQERVEWERERDKQEQRKGEIEKQIREALSQLSDEDLGRFVTGVRKKYSVKTLESDESLLERIPYLIIHELYERREENWRRIWEEIDKIDS